jgi:two-component system LytT family response regulator
MSSHRLKAVIVDDEAPARVELQRMLTAPPEVRVVAEADSVDRAVRIIGANKPDVLFLDIALGRFSGFDLLDRIEAPPYVVFVTAYDEHALRAFEVNALSYLLKPVQPSRLAEVIARLLSHTSSAQAMPLITLELDDYLFLEMRGSQTFVRVRDIRCISAEDNYSRLTVTNGQSALVRATLAQWLSRLPARRFAQIHRSTIVNLAEVERVEPLSASTQRVFLKQVATPFAMSRRYAARLQQNLA